MPKDRSVDVHEKLPGCHASRIQEIRTGKLNLFDTAFIRTTFAFALLSHVVAPDWKVGNLCLLNLGFSSFREKFVFQKKNIKKYCGFSSKCVNLVCFSRVLEFKNKSIFSVSVFFFEKKSKFSTKKSCISKYFNSQETDIFVKSRNYWKFS